MPQAAEEWVASGRKIRGVFTLKCKLEVIFVKIRGVFPSMQRKTIFFHVFESNKGNFSLYSSCFEYYFQNKGNFSLYQSPLAGNLISLFKNVKVNGKSSVQLFSEDHSKVKSPGYPKLFG
ncbi:hypothetical protein LCM00_11270 [Bacillus infantis]|uniref:hypothetical protein n=1 Tax=Bacillus infantis TaxID=324767 RepID=UPI001CD5828F|nr:hypothetical protein [Bacillus infantis]MCA1040080.1 hypothetical protein [Bacillus infantis]